MKSYLVTDKGKIELESNESVSPPEGFAKVRLTKIGICESDLEIFCEGEKIIPGRQGVGVVSEVNEGSSFRKNDRVFLNPYIPCENWIACKVEDSANCQNLGILGVNRDGFFRDFINIPESNLLRLPPQVTDSEAIYCEYISMALQIIENMKLAKGDHVGIVGGDILGNILAQLCIFFHAIPILIDSHDYNIELAKKVGIYFTVNEDENKFLHQITGGKMAKYVVYISGTKKSFKDTFSYARIGGKIVIAGLNTSKMMVNLNEILQKCMTITGVFHGMQEMRSAINMLVTKTVNVEHFSQKEILFKDIPFILKQEMQNEMDSIFQMCVDCLKE